MFYFAVFDFLSEEYREVGDVMILCVMSRLVFLSTSAQQNFLRAANKPGTQAVITFLTIALLPCCLLALIGSGAKLSEVGFAYACGNMVGALFFLLVSPYALRFSLRGISFKGFPIILSHMILFGFVFSQIARI